MAYVVIVKKLPARPRHGSEYDVMLYKGEDPQMGWAFSNKKDAITQGKIVSQKWRCRLVVRC